MNFVHLYILLLLLVVLPPATGMCLSGRSWASRLASRLFACMLYGFQTTIVLFSVWNATLLHNAWALPLITLTGWIFSMAVALGARPWFSHTPVQRGSFLFTICLSNHGYTLLGIIALLVFGDAGLSQAIYAQMLITPFLILVCFPAARYFSGETRGDTFGQLIRDNLLDKRNLPMLAMLAGLAFNLSGVERPAAVTGFLPVVVYAGTIVSGFAAGLLFNPSKIFTFKRENLFSIAYRSTLYPLFFLLAARCLNLTSIDTAILVLFGIVPSAIFANLIADMFNLDRSLANSVYLISTVLFLLFVLPVYLLAFAPGT